MRSALAETEATETVTIAVPTVGDRRRLDLGRSLTDALRREDPDDARLVRLSLAATSVTFEVADAPHASATVLLDRMPPVVADASEPAEVTVVLTFEQAERFAEGTISLPPLLLAGEVTYRGPVRKYLMVDSVLRALLSGRH